MKFHKIPSSMSLPWLFGSLLATDGQTDRQTDGVINFLERYMITTPSGFDNDLYKNMAYVASLFKWQFHYYLNRDLHI